jgi:hypothetical protein
MQQRSAPMWARFGRRRLAMRLRMRMRMRGLRSGGGNKPVLGGATWIDRWRERLTARRDRLDDLIENLDAFQESGGAAPIGGRLYGMRALARGGGRRTREEREQTYRESERRDAGGRAPQPAERPARSAEGESPEGRPPREGQSALGGKRPK